MEDIQEFNGPDPIGEQITPERRIAIPKDVAPKSLARPSYFSFGENGTTATVNAYGRILQISHFSAYGRSGFFCVDLPSMAEPYYVKRRMKNMLDLVEEPAAGIGVDWGHTLMTTGDAIRDTPTVEFIDDRWPLFTFGPSSASEQSRRDRRSRDSTPPTDSHQTTPSGEYMDSGSSGKSRLSIQYLCHGRSIFQRYVLARETHSRTADASAPNRLKMATNLLIRDMDFTERTLFNTVNRGPGYTFQYDPPQRSILVTHVIPEESRRNIDSGPDGTRNSVPLSVTLVIQPFANGIHQEVSKFDGTWYIDLSQEVQDQFRTSGMLDISIVYTLHFQFDEEPPAIPASDPNQVLVAFTALKNTGFERLHFSSHPHLDFTIRRNLEHILSVCSIPMTQIPVVDAEQHVTAVALTCGDASGHRVALSASFFAFQFLLCVERHLRANQSHKCSCKGAELPTCGAYSCRLRHRVQMTCLGHLKWAFCNTEVVDDRFSLHYWATGQDVKNTTGLPLPTPADTALQILKIFDPFIDRDLFDRWKSNLPESVEKNICKRIQAWAQDLEREDKRKKYAFARRTIDSQEKFRLADHVRIFSALRHVLSVGKFEGQLPPAEQRLSLGGLVEFISKYLDDKVVQRNILKRFTTTDPVSKQRMLATTRTASETRFLFHSKDTALFYSMDDGMFTKGQCEVYEDDDWDQQDPMWRTTMNCQAEYEEAQWPTRRKPLWFALMAIVSYKGQKISPLDPNNAMRFATEALLSISSANGLFPGLVDADQEPTHFQNKRQQDDYWHSSFEIPYILWRYGKDHLEEEFQKPTNNSRRSFEEPRSKRAGGGMLRRKTSPFINLEKYIDKRGLVEITDDWLQKGPKALDFTFEPRFLVPGCDGSPPYINVDEDLKEAKRMKALGEALRSLKSSQRTLSGSDKSVKGVVIDIPRTHDDDRKREGINAKLVPYDDLARTLGKTRTVSEAKKRIIWLPRGDMDTAALCYLATPPGDRVDMAAFFERHASYDKYFADEASAFLNEWNTELHISFYLVRDLEPFQELEKLNGIPEFDGAMPYVRSTIKGGIEFLGSDTLQRIARSSMSFRFVGDFFDRYWTCHFLEYVPANVANAQGASQNQPRRRKKIKFKEHLLGNDCGEVEITQRDGRKRYIWQQRRVLELLLVHRMLKEARSHTGNTLKWIRRCVLEKSTTLNFGDGKSASIQDMKDTWFEILFSTTNPLQEAIHESSQMLEENTKSYFSIVYHWRVSEQVLRILEEDLTENLERIEEWNRRETEREPETPRWTSNDEKTFRPTINRLKAQIQRDVRDLEHLRKRIGEFREALISRRTSIREDKSFRGSENINLLTYVTVIFLPLGFATGVFSMSGSPDKATLVGMIELASIAVTLTMFALANAQTSGKAIVQPIVSLFHSINETLVSPILQPFLSLELSSLVPLFLSFLYSPIIWLVRWLLFPLTEILCELCNWCAIIGVMIVRYLMYFFIQKIGLPLSTRIRHWSLLEVFRSVPRKIKQRKAVVESLVLVDLAFEKIPQEEKERYRRPRVADQENQEEAVVE